MSARLALSLILFLLVGACAGGPARIGAAATGGRVGAPGVYTETGIASWYGAQYHGRQTANGERFDMNALTAAHKTLPMSTYVRVTNLDNGRSLVLRINDRGPFIRGRIIDVSRRGAEDLGFLQQGLARVRIEAVAGPS